ncbi:MAG: hypothetical protein AAFX57_21010 [Bacteroidota bacterium]
MAIVIKVAISLMKLITLFVSILLFIGCQSNEQPFTSNYARIYDERINRDLATLLMTDSSQNKELFRLIDTTIEKLIIGSGGFNKNGILINGQRTGIAAIVLKEQNFFKQLSELLEEQKVDSARYEYLRTGFLTHIIH